LSDKEYIEEIQQIQSPYQMLAKILEEIDQGFFGHDPYYADIKKAIVEHAKKILNEHPESYPKPWMSVTVHINPKSGEIHCDGSREAIEYIKEKMYTNGKIHDTLHSIASMDNLAMAAIAGTQDDLINYINVLVARWNIERKDATSILCPICGKLGNLNCHIIHKECLHNISKVPHQIMLPGSIVRLKTGMLGNKPGTFGVCYEGYQLGKHFGSSFIFENGKYDGFSPDEQDEYLELIGQFAGLLKYRFTNVIQLSADFGAVDSPFKKALNFAKEYDI